MRSEIDRCRSEETLLFGKSRCNQHIQMTRSMQARVLDKYSAMTRVSSAQAHVIHLGVAVTVAVGACYRNISHNRNKLLVADWCQPGSQVPSSNVLCAHFMML